MDSLQVFLSAHAEALIGGALTVAGAAGLIVAWRERGRARASLAWPSVVGTVERSRPSYVVMGGGAPDDVGATDGEHVLVVRYRYEVEGRTHTGDRIRFGDEPAGTHAEVAADAARRLPAGTRVQVFYDPADPSEAVLERGQPGGDARWVLLSTASLALGAWVWWAGIP